MSGISVTRNDRNIVDNIDWTVAKGENWAVLGGNGSGKTSLLRVLMGYLTPSAGDIEMPGRFSAIDSPEQEWDIWRKAIGFVSSSIAEMIDPTERAIDVIMAGRHSMVNYWQKDTATEEADEKSAEKVLRQVHCEGIRNQPWAFLSQGERQRLLIGRALMAPKLNVLILDEPCAGLDPVARENFLNFISALTQKGTFKSLIMVTHHVEEIIPEISHALVLRDGQTVACGEKREALCSASVSKAFGGDLTLRSRLGRYRLYFDRDESEGPSVSKKVV